MSFTINSHKKTNRVQVINIKNEDLDRLIFPFQKAKHSLLLENLVLEKVLLACQS